MKRPRRTLAQRNLAALTLARQRIGDDVDPGARAVLRAVRALEPLVMSFCEELEASAACQRRFEAIVTPFLYASEEVTTTIDLETGVVTPWQPPDDELPKLDDPAWRATFARDVRQLCALATRRLESAAASARRPKTSR